ncbi:hypothetical protein Bca4012_076746 [Brassica carinata]|uniref:Uncharacterized protein n=3 Tax=Brassica TaxID=3705 RepID=A0A0D3D5Q8_BRAOL|nr:unnamed protein product [Brassica napus]CDY50724.1 BnaA05g35510D [Brassica napus]VDD36442.1 unnamed protein product [Brassica oleracea]
MRSNKSRDRSPFRLRLLPLRIHICLFVLSCLSLWRHQSGYQDVLVPEANI